MIREIYKPNLDRLFTGLSTGRAPHFSNTAKPPRQSGSNDESGFSLVEFFLSAAILLVISQAVFGALNRIQQTASCQAEVQAVVDNTRNALRLVERCIRQAGNDPHKIGFEAISIVSSSEVRIRSDITGSAGRNKGDPDGDLNDSRENVSIRYNGNKKRLEMISGNGPAQVIAENITHLSMKYFDADGDPTNSGSLVRKITVNLAGAGFRKDPRTGKRFGIQMESAINIRN